MIKTKKALIFGAASLSGQALTKELQNNGYIVIGTDIKENVDRSLFDAYYVSDITDKASVSDVMSKANPTHIFDLVDGRSFATWDKPQYSFMINEIGAINILDCAKDFFLKPKILLSGSSDEYASSNRPLFEGETLKPNTPYGLAKVVQEQLAEIYREKYHLDVFVVRQFDCLGVGHNRSNVVDLWCKQAARIKKGILPPKMYVGDLNVMRDYVDLRDVVEAYRLIIESSHSSEVYNVGYGISYSLGDILKFIISLTDMDIEVETNETIVKAKLEENKIVSCDHSKITKNLGWEPKHVIFDTITQIYQYYLEQE